MKFKKYDADVVKFNPNIKFERKYSIMATPEEIREFREKSPKEIISDFKELLADFNKESEENQEEIIRYQRKVPYHKEYLLFKYWQICRNYVLLRDKFQCKLSKKHTGRLNVHHNTYDYRGDDARHLDCLITLCESCHEIYEKIEKEKIHNGVNGNNISQTKFVLDDLEKTADGYVSKPVKPAVRKKRKTSKPKISRNKEIVLVSTNTNSDEYYLNHIIKITELYRGFNSKVSAIRNFI